MERLIRRFDLWNKRSVLPESVRAAEHRPAAGRRAAAETGAAEQRRGNRCRIST
jgi:hypothetical protein